MDYSRLINFRNVIIVSMLSWVVISIIALFSYSTNQNYTVDIRALPEDSKIFIDGNSVKQGRISLSPGSHTFKATSAGYKDDEYTLFIGDDTDIRLLPEPQTQEAEAYFSNNEEKQLLRETYGGIRANVTGIDFRSKNPMLEQLPISMTTLDGVIGPFSLDWVVSSKYDGAAWVAVNNSSPNGRANAINWIITNGYEPTDYEITFPDYVYKLEINQ